MKTKTGLFLQAGGNQLSDSATFESYGQPIQAITILNEIMHQDNSANNPVHDKSKTNSGPQRFYRRLSSSKPG